MTGSYKKNISDWSKAHVFYNLFNVPSLKIVEKLELDEYKWRKNFIKFPNGGLILANNFFNNLKNSSKFYLVHITPNFHNILENGNLFSSGGCLVGSTYCVPAEPFENLYRVHNLGKYIIEKELPAIFRKKEADVLLIEIELPDEGRNNLIGIDYLKLGSIHLNIYKNLLYLLSHHEREQLEGSCIKRIRSSLEFLNYCTNAYFNVGSINFKDFMSLFLAACNNLPILGYFYFEVLCEYIMLHQDNNNAKRYHDLGEFYCYTYKDLIYTVVPKLTENFSLKMFSPSEDKIIDYIRQGSIISNFSPNDFKKYIIERLIYLINSRLLSVNAIEWQKVLWNFDSLINITGPLLGHLIHRELRTFKRYPDFYYYFDQLKALDIWNYWNHMNVVVPFNGVFPKGEVGINPAYPDLKYKVFKSKTVFRDNLMLLELIKELKIRIAPRLVDPKFTTLRNKLKITNGCRYQ